MAIQTGSLTAYPQAVDDTYSNYPELTNPTIPVGKGSSNGAYAYWYSGYQSSRWTYWPFDLSEIPENAVIDSVKCLAKAGYYSASNVNIATLQLYCGNTAKGTATSFAGKTGQALSVDGGSWTREELKTCGLRVLGNSVGSNATYRRFYFYGADLTVEYTVNTQKFMLKLEGAYADIARVLQKIDGIWIEQDDLNNVVVSENGLINGGEYVAPNPVVNIFETGHSTNCYVTINGVKYTSEAKVSVEPGTVITLVMRGSSGSMPGAVFVDDRSQPVQYGTSVTYNHTVTNNIAIQLFYTVSGSSYAGMSFILTGVDANVSYFYADYGSGVFRFPFREGMTWAELCNSRYNILFGATVSGNQIGWSDGSYLADVKPTDVIVAGKTYTRTGL